MNIFEKMKTNLILNALLTILIGILFIANPGRSGILIAAIAGAVILISGIIDVIRFLGTKNRDMSASGVLVLGIAKLILGVIILTHTGAMLTLLIYLFGLFVLFGGIHSLSGALRLKKSDISGWPAHLTLAVLIIAAAVFMLFFPFAVVETAITISGVILIVDGVTELLTGIRMKRL